jgi:hypothetical protein
MKMVTHAFAHGRLLFVALSLVGGCGSNTGLPGTTGANMGMAGASSMGGAAGAVSTGNVGTTASGAAGTAPAITGAGGGGGQVDDVIPAGWTGAQPMMIQQSNCPSGGPFPPPFAVTETSGEIAGALTCVEFREFQILCGYVVDSSATTRVLVQPCDLHPTSHPKGDQSYNVTFKLPARADRAGVAIYERFDFYGATTPPVPMLLATVPVGASDDGGSSADGGVD